MCKPTYHDKLGRVGGFEPATLAAAIRPGALHTRVEHDEVTAPRSHVLQRVAQSVERVERTVIDEDRLLPGALHAHPDPVERPLAAAAREADAAPSHDGRVLRGQ